jgi:glutathione S-transferase
MGIRAAAESFVLRHHEMLDDAVQEGPFLLGPAPMGADFLISVLLSWLDRDKIASWAPISGIGQCCDD